MEALPTLDLTAFRNDPASSAGRAFVEALREACHRPGFCYLTDHGVDPDLEHQVMSSAQDFFALAEAERLSIVNTNTPHFRGYTILGMEHTGGRRDWRDQIDIGPEREPYELGPDDPAYLRLRGPNQWPAAVPAMQGLVTAWMDQMAGLGDVILSALALGLGRPGTHFEPYMAPEPEVLVKIIRYPSQTADTMAGSELDDQGVGLHGDSGLITFIMQDDVGGLQVQVDGELVDATPVAGTYILNLGEMLQVATNGYLRATKHRVVSPPPGNQRISVAYFYNPCMNSSMEPIVLPPELAAEAVGGQNPDPTDPVFATYGENWLKFRLRSHPDVAAKHYADLLADR
jgi:isopenicillin N synthase-like dioxygenase